MGAVGGADGRFHGDPGLSEVTNASDVFQGDDVGDDGLGLGRVAFLYAEDHDARFQIAVKK